MRLNENSKKVVLHNKSLIEHCKIVGINIEKLSNCNIEKVDNNYIFVLSKNTRYSTKTMLEYDLETQPDIVLTMNYNGNNDYIFKTTEYTVRIK